MKRILLGLLAVAMVTCLTACGATQENELFSDDSTQSTVSDTTENENFVNETTTNMVENNEVEEGVVEAEVTEQTSPKMGKEDELNELAGTFYEKSDVRLASDFAEYQGKMLKAYNINDEFILCEDGLLDGVDFYTFDTPIEDVIFHQRQFAFGNTFSLCKLKDGTTGVFIDNSDNKYFLVNDVDTEGAIMVSNYDGLRILYDDYTCSLYKYDCNIDENDKLKGITIRYMADEKIPFGLYDGLSSEKPKETFQAVRNDFKKVILPKSEKEYAMMQFNDDSVAIMEANIAINNGSNYATNEVWSYGSAELKYIKDFEVPVEEVILNNSYQILYKTAGEDKKVIYKTFDRTLTLNLPENYTVSDITYVTGSGDGVAIEFFDKSIWTTRSIEDIVDTNTFDLVKEEFLSQLSTEGSLQGYTTYNGKYFTFLSNGFMYTYSVR